MIRAPSWNRRKEIIYGTQDKVNPTRAAARRASLICKILGKAAPYYFWMLERIGTRDWTKFYGKDAADAMEVNEKTIDRWNAIIRGKGFIKIIPGKYKGQQSYSTYILLPINEKIGDDGHTPKKYAQPRDKLVPRPGDKLVPTKRASGKDCYSVPASPAASRFSDPGCAAVGSGPVAGASPSAPPSPSTSCPGQEGRATNPDDSTETIRTFLVENENVLAGLGFKSKSPDSLVQDIQPHYPTLSAWQEFLDTVWPLLLVKARGSAFLRKNRKWGFGKLWTQDPAHPGELLLQAFLFSSKYSTVQLPSKIYRPGQHVRAYGLEGVIKSSNPTMTSYEITTKTGKLRAMTNDIEEIQNDHP